MASADKPEQALGRKPSIRPSVFYYSRGTLSHHPYSYRDFLRRPPTAMSGFEIAGVILGTVPLLISALKQYGEGIKTITRILGYKALVDDLACNFIVVNSRFRLTCEKLLVRLGLPEEEITVLLKVPGGPAWKNEKLNTKIRSFLDVADYKGYTMLVARVFRTLDEFSSKLGLGKSFRVRDYRSDSEDKKRHSNQISTSLHGLRRMATSKKRHGISSFENLLARGKLSCWVLNATSMPLWSGRSSMTSPRLNHWLETTQNWRLRGLRGIVIQMPNFGRPSTSMRTAFSVRFAGDALVRPTTRSTYDCKRGKSLTWKTRHLTVLGFSSPLLRFPRLRHQHLGRGERLR
jgi:hypothetical protein